VKHCLLKYTCIPSTKKHELCEKNRRILHCITFEHNTNFIVMNSTELGLTRRETL